MIKGKREEITLAEKNTSENKNSNKRYRWLGIFLIALLLLFIGFAGYYLEKDLEPLSENNLTGSENIEKRSENGDGFFSSILEKIKDSIKNEESLKEEEKISDSENNLDSNGKTESSSKNIAEESKNDNIKNGKVDSDQIKKEDESLFEQLLSVLGIRNNNFEQNLNILFVGLDDKESVALGTIEADSIMLGYLRPKKNKLKLEKISQNKSYRGKLLRDYYNGEIKEAVEKTTETKIDHYVYVKYPGFEKVIDELGGVKINLDKNLKVSALALDLKAGDNLLSGKEALNFVRWKGREDFSRFQRQKLLLNSIVNKLKGNNFLFNVKEIYNTIVNSYNSIETDIDSVLAVEIFNYIRENDQFEIEYNN